MSDDDEPSVMFWMGSHEYSWPVSKARAFLRAHEPHASAADAEFLDLLRRAADEAERARS